jgi:hypothetical protein
VLSCHDQRVTNVGALKHGNQTLILRSHITGIFQMNGSAAQSSFSLPEKSLLIVNLRFSYLLIKRDGCTSKHARRNAGTQLQSNHLRNKTSRLLYGCFQIATASIGTMKQAMIWIKTEFAAVVKGKRSTLPLSQIRMQSSDWSCSRLLIWCSWSIFLFSVLIQCSHPVFSFSVPA